MAERKETPDVLADILSGDVPAPDLGTPLPIGRITDLPPRRPAPRPASRRRNLASRPPYRPQRQQRGNTRPSRSRTPTAGGRGSSTGGSCETGCSGRFSTITSTYAALTGGSWSRPRPVRACTARATDIRYTSAGRGGRPSGIRTTKGTARRRKFIGIRPCLRVRTIIIMRSNRNRSQCAPGAGWRRCGPAGPGDPPPRSCAGRSRDNACR